MNNKRNVIERIVETALILILIILMFFMMDDVGNLQGSARVIIMRGL